MKAKYALVLSVLLVALIGIILVSADVIHGTDSFNISSSEYSPGQAITGKLNISLLNESNDFFKVMMGNSAFQMILSDFLSANSAKFSCNPASCQESYREISRSSSANMDFSQSSSYLLGLKIDKGGCAKPSDASITTLTFGITGSSSNNIYAVPQIDVGNDKNMEWQFLESSDQFNPIGSNYNVLGTSESRGILPGAQYCEKIRFYPSSKYRISTNITTEGNVTFDLYAVSDASDIAGTCTASIENQTCDISYLNKDFNEFYVCASVAAAQPVDSINLYSGAGNNGLGFYKTDDNFVSANSETPSDFPVDVSYALPKNFDYTINMGNSDCSDVICTAANEYLQNCTDSGGYCMIPINISSIYPGKVSINNLKLVHTCLPAQITSFSSVSRENAKINMNSTLLDISYLNATVPADYGSTPLTIMIGSNTLYSAQFKVAQVPVITSISPLFVAAGAVTKFTVNAFSPKNNTLVSYQMDFGDGSSGESSTSSIISHKYSSTGNFTITVMVTDSEGLTGTNSFNIMAGEPTLIINQSLIEKTADIASYEKDLLLIPSWYSDLFTSRFKTSDMKASIKAYNEEYKTSSDLIALLEKINSLAVPAGIYDSLVLQESIPAFKKEDINLNFLETAGAGSYNSNQGDGIKTAIKNMQPSLVKISGVIKTVKKDNGEEEDVATVLTFKLTPENEMFFILQLPSGITFSNVKFASSYSQEDLNGAVGIKLSSSEDIQIAIEGKQDIDNIVAYLSPSFGSISVVTPPQETKCGDGKCDAGENTANCPSDCPPVGKAITLIIIVALITGAGIWAIWKFYVVIYERQQEIKLFKNRNDLVAITMFIVNAQAKGMGDDEIAGKLEQSGWKADQTVFAFMKIKKHRKQMERRIEKTRKLLEKSQKEAEKKSVGQQSSEKP